MSVAKKLIKNLRNAEHTGMTREEAESVAVMCADLIADVLKPIIDRLDRIDARLDGMDNRLDRMDDRLDRMDDHLDRIDNRLDKIDGRNTAVLLTVVFGFIGTITAIALAAFRTMF